MWLISIAYVTKFVHVTHFDQSQRSTVQCSRIRRHKLSPWPQMRMRKLWTMTEKLSHTESEEKWQWVESTLDFYARSHLNLFLFYILFEIIGCDCPLIGVTPVESLIRLTHCPSWSENSIWRIHRRLRWTHALYRPLYPLEWCTHNSWHLPTGTR